MKLQSAKQKNAVMLQEKFTAISTTQKRSPTARGVTALLPAREVLLWLLLLAGGEERNHPKTPWIITALMQTLFPADDHIPWSPATKLWLGDSSTSLAWDRDFCFVILKDWAEVWTDTCDTALGRGVGVRRVTVMCFKDHGETSYLRNRQWVLGTWLLACICASLCGHMTEMMGPVSCFPWCGDVGFGLGRQGSFGGTYPRGLCGTKPVRKTFWVWW